MIWVNLHNIQSRFTHKIKKYMMIKSFEEWNELNEAAKYHFDFEHTTYTIHQSKSDPSKFGIKKDGKWSITARGRMFDPKKYDMKPKEFLAYIQRGIKHFNIIGTVDRKSVFESEWRPLFKYELKHNTTFNKKNIILKLHCGKRNAWYNIQKAKEKVNENEQDIEFTDDEKVYETDFGIVTQINDPGLYDETYQVWSKWDDGQLEFEGGTDDLEEAKEMADSFTNESVTLEDTDTLFESDGLYGFEA